MGYLGCKTIAELHGQAPEYSFGLGRSTLVQQVVVEMPDGSTQVFKDPKINHMVVLK
jgi:hypothetical protein